MNINSLKKYDLIKYIKKLQEQIYEYENEFIFEDIDYIKKINKLEEENKKLRLQLNNLKL